MKKFYLSAAAIFLLSPVIFAQTTQPPKPVAPAGRTVSENRNVFDFSEYGVRIEPDERLIVVMAALDAAGFNPTVNTAFHQELRRDISGLDADLRRRLREFFQRSNRGLETATPTEQAARYVSLAYALEGAPDLTAPARTTDLPAGLLEVLDFAPLVAEFYRKSGIADKLPDYKKKYQNYADGLRPNLARAIGGVTAYLNTRPQLISFERVTTTNKDVTAKKNQKATVKSVEVKETPRTFYIVPDLLGAPNSAKLRVIGDNYYAIIGSAVEPENSTEFRRAYLQFLVDPLVYKNATEISVQREGLRGLLDELAEKKRRDFNQAQAAGKIPKDAVFEITFSPDPFLAVARSFVVAAEVRDRKLKRIARAERDAQIARSQNKTPDATEIVVDKNHRLTFPRAEAEAFAELAEAYDNGAILAFYFDERLKGVESSGFDATASFADMIATLDANKEKSRLKESALKREQAIAALTERRANAAKQSIEDVEAETIRNNSLVAGLNQVETLLKTKDYETAETRLKELLSENPGEPRILFALGRAASVAAENAFDEDLRNERLKKAATYYVNLLQIATPDNASKALVSNTHVALARIYEFYMDENDAYKTAALKSFDAAIALGEITGGAYQQAVAGKQRLTQK